MADTPIQNDLNIPLTPEEKVGMDRSEKEPEPRVEVTSFEVTDERYPSVPDERGPVEHAGCKCPNCGTHLHIQVSKAEVRWGEAKT